MAESFFLPYEYVDRLINPGLQTSAGPVKLNQYLCKTRSNGGNDSATSFFKQFRWIKDADGMNLQQLVGGNAIDLALKGQGNDKTFVKIWDFMLKNKDLLDKYKVEVCDRAKKDGSKDVKETGKIKRIYFDKMSDRAALQAMVQDRFFGMDCIGFVANFLIHTGEWDKYHGVVPKNYPKNVAKINIDDIKEVKPLDFMVWNGHVALVDWVWKLIDNKSAQIDMCQSSSGGPQCNEYVTLKETGGKGLHGGREFTILGGTPAPPVRGHFTIWRREGFWY
ncbi:hypothetical protein [uncultured Roseibium sp.]|uniref:hypothetical protein n=1 Tax=uncultured Roseibium sp. TaxID=1936171 RepID=UPI00260B2C28|nr:hypothetical protein [uncultured Roseibium sp.]